MRKRTLGRTGLQVTTLGYGAMELRHLDQAEAGRLLNAVLDAGINVIDTSPDYGPSEDHIGSTIAGRRDEYLLATKCGCNIPRRGGEEAPGHIWTGEQVRHNIEHSLRRLRTDRIDVWQIHSADPRDLRDSDVLETMLAVRDEGKVRVIAASSRNGDAPRYGRDQIGGYLEWEEFDVFQVWYSALARINEAVIARAADQGRGLIIRGTVRSVMGSREEAWRRAGLDDLVPAGQTRDQFLIRFAIAHPWLHTNIVGTRSREHLQQNIDAVAAGPLPDDVVREARVRLEAAGIVPEE